MTKSFVITIAAAIAGAFTVSAQTLVKEMNGADNTFHPRTVHEKWRSCYLFL